MTRTHIPPHLIKRQISNDARVAKWAVDGGKRSWLSRIWWYDNGNYTNFQDNVVSIPLAILGLAIIMAPLMFIMWPR